MPSAPRRSVGIGLVLFVAVLVVAAAGFGPAPADSVSPVAAQEGTPTPTPEPPGRVTFGDSVYEVTAGETLRLNLSFQDVDQARIGIGDRTTQYRLNATVTDADGDGNVTLLFDTSAAGVEGSPLSVAGEGDQVEVLNETTFEEPVTFATLPTTASVEGIETGSASILIREPLNRNETATPTPTPTPTETPGMTPTETPDGTPADGANGEDTPGFGVLAAVVALLAAVALRRATR